jgi:YD repeat-containing protein
VSKSYDALGVWSVPTYDGDGRVKKTTLQNGVFTSMGYDDQGRKSFEIDAVNQKTEYGYDVLGRLTTIKQAAVFDPISNITKQPVTTFGFNAYGQQTSIADANGRITKFDFNQFGQQTSRTLPDDGNAATNEREEMAYNSFGDLDYSIDFNGTKVDRVYDYEAGSGLSTKFGRLAKTTWTAQERQHAGRDGEPDIRSVWPRGCDHRE